MRDTTRREEEALAQRLLRPLAEERPTPPDQLVGRVRRRAQAWCLLRDSLGFATGAYRRFVLDLLPRRPGGRRDRKP